MTRAVKRGVMLVSALFLVCGCGASGGALRQVVRAARKTHALPWVRYRLTLARPQLFSTSITVLGGRAAYDFHTELGYEVLGLQRSARGPQELWLDFTPAALLASPSPMPAGLLPPGFGWIRVTFAARSSGGKDRLAAQVEGLAPELPLDEIAWGTRAAHALGTATVGHVPMTEYRVSVDLKRALAAAGRAHRPAVAAAIRSELSSSPNARLSLRVWLDGPGYLGRIDVAPPGTGLGTVTLVFTSFSEPYTGTQPPPSQVLPFAAVAHRPRSFWAAISRS